jgi:RHS repeat-associated protein
VAVLNGSTIYFLHDDRLRTPQLATDSSQNIQWQASYEPFGTTTSVSGTITQNLRFPGQYFDVESGWNHNGFRDYMPNLGRYLEPDPLAMLGTSTFYDVRTGLLLNTDTFLGGTNSYGYVADDPIDATDPQGLAACVYSISAHTMVCQPNSDPGQPTISGPQVAGSVTLGPSGVASGGSMKGPTACTNNNKCQNNRFEGPIVPGNYRMNYDTRPEHQGMNVYRLEPSPHEWYTGLLYDLHVTRGGFELHLGTISLGCINADKTNPVAAQQYQQLNGLLQSGNGSNYLTVLP